MSDTGTVSVDSKRIDDVAKALDLLLHMVKVLAEDDKPSFEDVGEVKELIERIKYPHRS